MDTWRILCNTNIAKSFERANQSSEKIIGRDLSRACRYLSTQVFIPQEFNIHTVRSESEWAVKMMIIEWRQRLVFIHLLWNCGER